MSWLRFFLSAEGAKNVSWPFLSPLQGRDSLTIAFNGKFVCICIYIYIKNSLYICIIYTYIHSIYIIYITYIIFIYMCGWCCVVWCGVVWCVCVCVSIIFNLNKSRKNRRFQVEDEEPFEYFFCP